MRRQFSELHAKRFNPRPRVGGDIRAVPMSTALFVFQSTPPRGGRPPNIIKERSSDLFQSTPPRGGRRVGAVDCLVFQRFQSTPPRGGRPATKIKKWLAKVFQSTPPRGGRRVTEYQDRGTLHVSIHAPAWGATVFAIPFWRLFFRFNPRPRVGGDAEIQALRAYLYRFNPRPRVGGDEYQRIYNKMVGSFNPRPRVGGDGKA